MDDVDVDGVSLEPKLKVQSALMVVLANHRQIHG